MSAGGCCALNQAGFWLQTSGSLVLAESSEGWWGRKAKTCRRVGNPGLGTWGAQRGGVRHQNRPWGGVRGEPA